ncbi:O-antigen ligase family protein [Paracoccus siganidrum]|nr:O-antigen ligase family protein [Paracoccus siganidrum]
MEIPVLPAPDPRAPRAAARPAMTAPALPMGPSGAISPRVGQRAFWRLFDLSLAGLAIMVAGDTFNRWGVSGPLWALIYAMAVLRILTVWPAFHRVLARNRIWLAYPLVALSSVVWSVDRPLTLVAGVQLTMSVLIAFFIGWRFAPRKLIVIGMVALGAGVLASALNWATLAFGGPLHSAVGGLLGIYTNKNMLGHFGLMAALLAMTVALLPPGQAPRGLRIAALALVPLCVFMVVLSLSMTAVLLLPCFLVLLLLLNRRRLPPGLRFAMLSGIVLLIGAAPLAMGLAGLDPLALLFQATGKDATLTGRTELWRIAAGQIAQAPLTGFGFRAFWESDQFRAAHFAVLRAGSTAPSFHNFIADVMIGSGLAGLVAILALVARSLSLGLCFYLREGSPVAAGSLVTLLLPLSLALVEPYLYRQHELMMGWMVMMGVSIFCHAKPLAGAQG